MSTTQLPPDLQNEILARVPPLSLARFRTVCRRWNTVLGDKSFIKQHLACVCPQFILRIFDSKIYSIGINLDDSLQVRELHIETRGHKKLDLYRYRNFFYCDGFLLCPAWPDKVVIWNPWLRQGSEFIEPNWDWCNLYGVGYDNSRRDKVYKILGFSYNKEYVDRRTIIRSRVAIYDFATFAWKNLSMVSLDWQLMSPRNVLSLNGTLYWIAGRVDNRGDRFVQSFDFSTEMFKPFCLLPSNESTQVLQVYRGDRLSILEQCMSTKKVNIWVTKNMISGDSNEPVSWRLLLTVSVPEFPIQRLYYSNSQLSYFIDNNDDKRLIVCTCDETGKPWIYIMKKEDRFKKIQMGFEVEPWPFHLVYIPSLVPIPQL